MSSLLCLVLAVMRCCSCARVYIERNGFVMPEGNVVFACDLHCEVYVVLVDQKLVMVA